MLVQIFKSYELTISLLKLTGQSDTMRAVERISVLVLVTQSCPTVCDPIGGSLPCSSVHGILQARMLEWVAIPFFRGIFPAQGSNPGLLIAGRFCSI